jgi:hypothetical protein
MVLGTGGTPDEGYWASVMACCLLGVIIIGSPTWKRKEAEQVEIANQLTQQIRLMKQMKELSEQVDLAAGIDDDDDEEEEEEEEEEV